jgi:hypothetical protein
MQETRKLRIVEIETIWLRPRAAQSGPASSGWVVKPYDDSACDHHCEETSPSHGTRMMSASCRSAKVGLFENVGSNLLFALSHDILQNFGKLIEGQTGCAGRLVSE